MALADLLGVLREESSAREAAELARADAEATRIGEESHAARERRRAHYVARVRRDEEEAAARALSRAEAEARASVLAARDRLLRRVADALRDRIGRAPSDPLYLETLPGEVRSGLARLPPGPLVVRARPDLVGAVRAALGGREDAVVEACTETGTGFTATSTDHGVAVDGTLEARLEHEWPRTAVFVLGRLDP